MRITAAILFVLFPVCLWGCGIQDTDNTGETPEVSTLRLTLTALPGFADAALPEMITRKTGQTVEVDLRYSQDVSIPANAGWSLTYEPELCSPEKIEFTEQLATNYLHMAADREEGRVLLVIADGGRETSQETEQMPGLCRVTFSFEPFSKRAFSQPEISAGDAPLLRRDESGLSIEWTCGLEGDLNGDLTVDPLDLLALTQSVSDADEAAPVLDLTGDGRLDQADADVLSKLCGARLTGYRVERISPTRKNLGEIALEELESNACLAFDGSPGFGDMQYTVTPLIEGGLRGRAGTTPVIRIAPPPGPVRGFRTQANDGTALLQWWPPDDETEPAGYRIYRAVSGDDAWEKLKNELTETSFEFTDAEPGVVYRFRVSAMNVDGLEGESSQERTFTLDAPICEAPEQPACLSRLASILIEWEPDPDYRHAIYRSDSIDGAWKRIAEVEGSLSLFDDFDVQRGGRYFYRLAHIDSHGNESTLSPVQAGRALEHRYPRLQQNRVFNGGFELGGAFWNLKDNVSPLERWEYSIVSLGEAYTGDYACGLIREPRPELNDRRPGPSIRQQVRLNPNTRYRLGFHSRADGVAMIRAKIKFGGERHETKNIFSGLDWELNRLEFRTGPEDKRVMLSIILEQGDAVYLDDVRIEVADGVTPEIVVFPDQKAIEAKPGPGGMRVGDKQRAGLFFAVENADTIDSAQRSGAEGVVVSPLPEMLDLAQASGLYVIGGGDFVQGIIGTSDPQFLPLAFEFYGAHPAIVGWYVEEPTSGLNTELIENCLMKDEAHPLLLDGTEKKISGACRCGDDVHVIYLSSDDWIVSYLDAFMRSTHKTCCAMILKGWDLPAEGVDLDDCISQLDSLLQLFAAGAVVSEVDCVSYLEHGGTRMQWGHNDSGVNMSLTFSELGVNRDKAILVTDGEILSAGLSLAVGEGFVILEKD